MFVAGSFSVFISLRSVDKNMDEILYLFEIIIRLKEIGQILI